MAKMFHVGDIFLHGTVAILDALTLVLLNLDLSLFENTVVPDQLVSLMKLSDQDPHCF